MLTNTPSAYTWPKVIKGDTPFEAIIILWWSMLINGKDQCCKMDLNILYEIYSVKLLYLGLFEKLEVIRVLLATFSFICWQSILLSFLPLQQFYSSVCSLIGLHILRLSHQLTQNPPSSTVFPNFFKWDPPSFPIFSMGSSCFPNCSEVFKLA